MKSLGTIEFNPSITVDAASTKSKRSDWLIITSHGHNFGVKNSSFVPVLFHDWSLSFEAANHNGACVTRIQWAAIKAALFWPPLFNYSLCLFSVTMAT